VGVVRIEGDFQKGDLVRLVDEENHTLGFGLAEYGADKARERLGQHGQRPLVHYDYLFLNLDT
jgi:glutamate 5-kinase